MPLPVALGAIVAKQSKIKELGAVVRDTARMAAPLPHVGTDVGQAACTQPPAARKTRIVQNCTSVLDSRWHFY